MEAMQIEIKEYSNNTLLVMTCSFMIVYVYPYL